MEETCTDNFRREKAPSTAHPHTTTQPAQMAAYLPDFETDRS